MKLSMSLCQLTFCLLLGALPACGGGSSATGSYGDGTLIKGVLQSATGEPLSDVVVTVEDTMEMTVTDENGEFELETEKPVSEEVTITFNSDEIDASITVEIVAPAVAELQVELAYDATANKVEAVRIEETPEKPIDQGTISKDPSPIGDHDETGGEVTEDGIGDVVPNDEVTGDEVTGDEVTGDEGTTDPDSDDNDQVEREEDEIGDEHNTGDDDTQKEPIPDQPATDDAPVEVLPEPSDPVDELGEDLEQTTGDQV